MKKIILIITFFFLSVYTISANQQRSNDKSFIIYTLEQSYSFDGYVIKNNELYICLSYDFTSNTEKKHAFKYQNKQLVELDLEDREIDLLWKNIIPTRNAEDYDIFDDKIVVNDEKHIKLVPYYTEEERLKSLARGIEVTSANKFFELVDGEKRKVLSENYMCLVAGVYFYVDRINEKIYFYGKHIYGDRKTRMHDEYLNDTIGIFVCDLKTEKYYNIRTEKVHNPCRKTFLDPIRIPNTPYLLYRTYDLGGEWADSSKLAVKNIEGTEFWIQEISDWK